MKNVLTFMLALLLSGCMANIDRTRTNALDGYTETTIKEKLTAGSTTKKDILLLLGVPAFPLEYNKMNTWIYKSTRKDRRIYFFIPFNNDKDQILSLNFNSAGVLNSYNYIDSATK